MRSWPAAGPTSVWTRPVDPAYGAASVRGGKVYFLGGDPAAMKERVHCIDLATGRDLWTFEYYSYGDVPFGGRGQPAVDEDRVFALGPMGDLHALDRHSGRRLWSVNILGKPRNADDVNAPPPRGSRHDGGGLWLPPSHHPKWGVQQCPLVYRDTVLVAVLSDEASVVAFDKGTGRIRWHSPPSGRMTFTHQTPLLATIGGEDQVIIAGNYRGSSLATMAAFDAAGGALRWRHTVRKWNMPIPTPVAIDGERVFVAGGYYAGCFMLTIRNSGGTCEVSRAFSNFNCTPQLQTPILYRDHLYATSDDPVHNGRMGVPNRGLMCLGLDGEVRWQTGPDRVFHQGPILIADGMLLAMDGRTGVLHLVEAVPTGYRLLSHWGVFDPAAMDPMQPGLWSPMALADGKLILRDARRMECLQVSGAPLVPGAGGPLP